MLTLEQIADRLGVKIITARLYHNRATRYRRENREGRYDLPAPTVIVGRSPRWSADVIEDWLAERPGRGRPKSS